jgi:endogenous inhibitor of DNA gyrase (YacG/DUF329 family)
MADLGVWIRGDYVIKGEEKEELSTGDKPKGD